MENNILKELKTWAENEATKCLNVYSAVKTKTSFTHQYIGEHTAFSLVVDKIKELESEPAKLNDVKTLRNLYPANIDGSKEFNAANELNDEGEEVKKLAELEIPYCNVASYDNINYKRRGFVQGYKYALQNKAKNFDDFKSELLKKCEQGLRDKGFSSAYIDDIISLSMDELKDSFPSQNNKAEWIKCSDRLPM